MRRLLHSPFLIIALLMGGCSAFLAYRGENEAAMAGAGVAVAAATARSSEDGSDDPDEPTQAAWLKAQLERLEAENRQQRIDFQWEKNKLMLLIERAEDIRRNERDSDQKIAELKQDLLSQRFEQQAKIRELELKIERLESGTNLLKEDQRAGLLPESESEAFEVEEPETQIIETSKNCE